MSDTIDITCPSCNAVLECDDVDELISIECPDCGKDFDFDPTPQPPNKVKARISYAPKGISDELSARRKESLKKYSSTDLANQGRMSNESGFDGLFDFSFRDYVSPSLIRFLYVLDFIGIIFISIAGIIALISIGNNINNGGVIAIAGIIILLFVMIHWLFITRMSYEYLMVIFSIENNTRLALKSKESKV